MNPKNCVLFITPYKFKEFINEYRCSLIYTDKVLKFYLIDFQLIKLI
jgi:hypothetical protein